MSDARRFDLLRCGRDELTDLCCGRIPPALVACLSADALPPMFVAARCLARLDAGEPELWCSLYLIREVATDRVAGGCYFKAAPRYGQIEVAYGVARPFRRRGAASAGLAALVELAFANGVHEVQAEVALDNAASMALLRRAGWRHRTGGIAADGVAVSHWSVQHGA